MLVAEISRHRLSKTYIPTVFTANFYTPPN